MKLRDWILLAVIAVEVTVGVLVARSWLRPVPPPADLSLLDPLTASELRALQQCHSTDDWAKLGEAYQAFGYFAEGEACYRFASQSEPHRADLAFAWAFALERLGQLEQANEQYKRAVQLGHERPEACWYFIGRNRLRQEDAGSAREAFVKAKDLPAARYELARLSAREGDRVGALALLDQLSADRESIQPLLLRHRLAALANSAKVARSADRVELARRRLITPFDGEIARLEKVGASLLGEVKEFKVDAELLTAGRGDEASTRLREALQQQWNPSLADLLAEAELRAGRFDEAVRLLRDAVDRAGPSVHRLTRLGAAYYKAGRQDKAVEHWSRAAELGFGGTVRHLLYKLATYYQGKGNETKSRAYFARAYHGAGHEAFWSGNMKAARATLEKSVEYDPGLAASWFYLGQTHRLQGEAELARKAYQGCLKIDPDHGRARAALALLDAKAGP